VTFPSLEEIKPRLRVFFSSRFVIVEVGQSPGAGAAAETSSAPLFDAYDITLAAALLKVAPAATVEPFFFTILGCVWEYEKWIEEWRRRRDSYEKVVTFSLSCTSLII
jgi:hypothetical protein